MDRIPVPSLLREIASVFSSRGRKAYLVGGAVRDILLKKEPGDWDIATDAPPEEVRTFFRRVIPTGIEHGTVTIHYKGAQVECTTFRTEEGYSDGRRPDAIRYAATVEEDLSRRDFTMNAIAVSLPDGIIVDPEGGRADIKAGVIRTVGRAEERFAEDGLRPLRAVRFAAQLGFAVDPATLAAIRPALPVSARVARERVRDELVKALGSTRPSLCFRLMEDTGLLGLFLPELARCRGVDQRGNHRLDVLDHLLLACDLAPAGDLVVRLAALLHDVGKPDVRAEDGSGGYTFHRHEARSAEIALAVLDRLRFPKKTVEEAAHLVREHMFHYEDRWTDAAVRRFLVRVGVESLDRLLSLRLADTGAIAGIPAGPETLLPLRKRVDAVLAERAALSIADLAVNGNDLAALGIPRGPQLGIILRELFETALDDPAINERGRLLEIAERIWIDRMGGKGGDGK